MIRGYNFKEQLSDADIDSMIYRKMLNYNDGICKGLELTNTSSNISVSEGIVSIAGRFIAIVGNESIDIDLENAFCKLILEIDLTKESTETDFKQVSLRVLKSASDYPSLTQNDMDNGGNIYQFELAKFKTSTSGISDFVDTKIFLNTSLTYKYKVLTTTTIVKNTNYTIPAAYSVGANNLDVRFENCELILGENYIEIGTGSSKIIQFKDWDVPIGSNLEFVIRR